MIEDPGHGSTKTIFWGREKVETAARREMLADGVNVFCFLIDSSLPSVSAFGQMATDSSDLQDFMQAVLDLDSLGVRDVLEWVGKRFNSFGCGIWEVNGDSSKRKQGVPLSENAPRLITVAAWWANNSIFALDSVPVVGSPTGACAIGQEVRICHDIQREECGAEAVHPFWKKNDVRRMCAVPLRFHDGSRGALNVYRKSGGRSYTLKESARLATLAKCVPGLLRIIQERRSLKLVGEVDAILRTELTRGSSPQPRIEKGCEKICKAVSSAFDCVEASIFLAKAEYNEKPNRFKLQATTNKRCASRKVYTLPEDEETYTGKAIYSGESVIVPNMGTKQWKFNTYSEPYDQFLAKALSCPVDELPPASLLAVPIMESSDFADSTTHPRVWGVIRCAVVRSGPYVFSQKQEAILKVIAAQIGKWWAADRFRLELRSRLKNWRQLATAFRDLNDYALAELQADTPDRRKIIEHALELTAKVLPGANLNSVRLKGVDSLLHYEAFSTELQRLRQPVQSVIRPVPMDKRKAPLANRVIDKGDTLFAIKSDGRREMLTDDVIGMICAPIRWGGENRGTFDLRWTAPVDRRDAKFTAVRIGNQLSLFLQMFDLVTSLRAETVAAQKLKADEISASEVLGHQLKSPTKSGLEAAETLLGAALDGRPVERPARMLRGMVRRIASVVESMRAISELARGRPIPIRCEPLIYNRFQRRLTDLAIDSELLPEAQERRIIVGTKFDDLDRLSMEEFFVDLPLVIQMVSNLIDNALKYGAMNSRIQIEGSISARPAADGRKRRRLIVKVINKTGYIRLLGTEKELCKKREWRSGWARMVDNTGKGLGLWYVDQIMQAHGGTFQVNPKDSVEETEMWLVFPSQNPKVYS